ncbi:rRNA biogenesis protein rrp5 [Acidaminococcus fermentans]|uniref:rRNA biogenesis protein rrp5 n=1 Tax=Acidaminococcus fermentans TaxID=905 RepID=A0A6N7VMM9_ACIFE|nr:rRNA biogenesis protein rrp5 [Acidaminococcus fermentans]MSS82260.1 rRNA biogenesis protein rrp5 [Acidaminococcus fermentans]
MTNDELQKLAAGLSDFGKALLRMADALMEKKEEVPAAEEEKKPEKKLSLEDVRRVAADKARQGHTDEVRQLIQKFGADKLSGVDATKYPALMEELEAMGHAD